MQVLVSHDGELDDLCGVLFELGHPPRIRRGATPLSDLSRSFDLVVATPARALRLGTLLANPETRSIVVAEPGTRTAGRRLHQLGVEWIVRRPVHPSALRLLLRHSLYRGPERRRTGRVSVGLPIRYRAGWLPRTAVLREVSLRGASLVAGRPIPPGRRITLHVTDGGRDWTLAGEVVRCRTDAQARSEIGVAFDAHPANPLQPVRELVARYARGPASYAGLPPPVGPARAFPAELEPPRGERREAERRAFPHRVVALHDDAPRVLIGRDLSLGGMSIERGAPLDAGQRLKLALHVRPGEIPLVLDAEVVRSSAAGAGLRFDALTDTTRAYLERMLDSLPALAAPSAGLGEERRVLAELVE